LQALSSALQLIVMHASAVAMYMHVPRPQRTHLSTFTHTNTRTHA